VVKYDTLVVGAGFAGATIAERLGAVGESVLVIDRRDHVGGTVYDHLDEHGILISSHGAHLFHTNARSIVDYLSQFTDWVPHRHRVEAIAANGRQVPMPVNRTTINRLFDLSLETREDVEAFYEAVKEDVPFRTSEDQVVGHVGRGIFELLYEQYTLKQWGRPAEELSSSVAGRLPYRTSDEDGYFDDWFQAQPRDGWTSVFTEMLFNVDVQLEIDFKDLLPSVEYDRIVYTGPPDEFFDYELGKLPFRSVRFEHVNHPGQALQQSVPVLNDCTRHHPYTRTIEWRHITGQVADSTTVSYEFSEAQGDPHYPIPCTESWALHRAYRELAESRPDVVFAGRLGTYRYMTMDQTVGQALKLASKLAPDAAIR
jgi:UDP-galactopyranose mutase